MATIRNLLIRISVTENTDKGIRRVTAGLRETNREIDDADKGSNRFTRTLSRLGRTSLTGLTNGLGLLAKGTKTAAIGLTAVAAAASSLNTVVGAGTALAPLAGGLLLLPSAALAAATAFGTLKLAISGMGDAFKAALGSGPQDPKKFAAALKQLAPAARGVAVELHNLRPELLGIKNAAQQALFAPLTGQLTAIAHVLAGPVRTGVSAVAGQFGVAARQVTNFVRQAKTIELVKAAFGQTQLSVAILSGALQPVLAGFRALGTEGLSFLPGIAAAVERIAARFGVWLQQIVASGQATQWINNALATLKQLFGVVSQVGGILKSVFSAASAAGSGFLGVIGTALAKLNQFLKTAEGKSALHSIFQGLAAIGQSLAPVIGALVTGLGTLAGPVGRLAQLIGPILTTVVQALAPALAALEPGLKAIFVGLGGAVTALAPALLPLGRAIAQIGVAIGPILPVIGQLAALVAQQLAASLTQLVLILGPVIAALATSLAPVLPQIAKAFADVAVAMAPIATQFGQQLAQALVKILPPLIQIVPQLLTGLLPALTQLAIAMVPLLPQLIQLGVVLATNLSDSLPQLIPPLITLVGLMVQWAIIMVPVLGWIIQISTALASVLGPGVTTAVKVIAAGLKLIFGWFQWLFDVLLGHSIIPDIVRGIVNWFGALPRLVTGFFADMARGAVGKVGDMLRSLSGIPSSIQRIFGGAGSWLYNVGRNIIIGLWNGLASLGNWLYNRVVALARAVIPAPIRWALGISSPSKVTTELGRFAGLGLAAGLVGTAARVRSAAGTLAKAAVPALASPAGVGATARAPAGVAAAGAAGGRGGGGTARVWFDWGKGNGELKKMFQKIIRVDGGGDVEAALGGTS